MPALSKSHAEELLDPILSRFGPWDLVSFAPAGLTFTVVLDAAESEFASVQLVTSTRPPKGAVLDERFKGYIPFVTDFAFDWASFRKAAARILAIPPGAIAIGVDTRGTAIIIHAIGFSEAERKAVGRDRMTAVALRVGLGETRSNSTRPNPRRRGGGPQQQGGVLKHSAEWNRISQHDAMSADWIMRRAGRDFANAVVILSAGPTLPKDATTVSASNFSAIERMTSPVKVFHPRKNQLVGTWTELRWQEVADQPAFGKARSGQHMIDDLMSGQGLSWEMPADRERLFRSKAEPLIDMEFPPESWAEMVQWLWHKKEQRLEVEWSHTYLDKLRAAAAYMFSSSNRTRVIPSLQIVAAHLQAVVDELKIMPSATMLIDGWDEKDYDGNPFRITVGSFLKALRDPRGALVPEKEDPGLTGAREFRAAAREGPDRTPDIRSAIRDAGGTNIIDPVGTSERLLEDNLLPEDFFLEDYVDEDPHFVTVRAATYMPPELEGKYRDALKAKSNRRVTLKLTPRFPQWAAGEVFKEWHRRNSVRKRRLMEVWVQLDRRRAELEKISLEKTRQVHDLEAMMNKFSGAPTEDALGRLQTARIFESGLRRSLSDLRELAEKVRLKLKKLGVVWAGDPGAMPSADEALAWAEKWLKDKAWREAMTTSFRGGRLSVTEKVQALGPAVRRFWQNLDAAEDDTTGTSAGLLRQVKMAIGRWQSSARLRDLLRNKVISKKLKGLGKQAFDASGWAAIGEDFNRMVMWATTSWGDLKDVAKFSGGIVTAPATVIRARLGVPAAKLHDWLEEEALPGFSISVRKLARRKQRLTRKFDSKTGDSVFVDESGKIFTPPRTAKHERKAAARPEVAALAAARKAKRTEAEAKKAGKIAKRKEKARIAMVKAYHRALKHWRSIRMREDADGVRQTAAALATVRKLAEKLASLGIPVSDEG